MFEKFRPRPTEVEKQRAELANITADPTAYSALPPEGTLRPSLWNCRTGAIGIDQLHELRHHVIVRRAIREVQRQAHPLAARMVAKSLHW